MTVVERFIQGRHETFTGLNLSPTSALPPTTTYPGDHRWQAEREAMSSRLDSYLAAHPEADVTTAIMALERGEE